MSIRETEFFAELEAFVSQTGMRESAVGRGALNDHHLMRDLRNGRRLYPETKQKIRDFMNERRNGEGQTHRPG